MAKANVVEELAGRSDGLTTFESRLVNLLALLLTQERTQAEQIDLLNRAGFRPAEIASLLGTTSNTVSVALSVRKHAKTRKKAKKRK
jgi:CRP-like cAMP-binding protein